MKIEEHLFELWWNSGMEFFCQICSVIRKLKLKLLRFGAYLVENFRKGSVLKFHHITGFTATFFQKRAQASTSVIFFASTWTALIGQDLVSSWQILFLTKLITAIKSLTNTEGLKVPIIWQFYNKHPKLSLRKQSFQFTNITSLYQTVHNLFMFK